MGKWSSDSPDLPRTITGDKNEANALAEASDLLGSAIAYAIAEKELIAVPFWIAGKFAVYQALREAGITDVELAKRLGVTEVVVRRLLDPDHETRMVNRLPPSPSSGKNS